MIDIYFFGIYDLIIPKRTLVDQTAISWDSDSGKLQVETEWEGHRPRTFYKSLIRMSTFFTNSNLNVVNSSSRKQSIQIKCVNF